MSRLQQSPTDPDFVQSPYGFYSRARSSGAIQYWDDYGMNCAFSYATVNACLRDNRLGREVPDHLRRPVPDHLRDFYAIDDNSMLELEPPRHTRLRKLVLRAFTSRRIAALEPEIITLCHDLIDRFPSGPHDLLKTYATQVPVLVIARLLGVPDNMATHLLRWSNDMVALYQARRDHAVEVAANTAARDFATFMREYVDSRRKRPADDLITHLIAAEEDGETLSTDELIATCVLLLNAGHEATVHTMGNGVKTLLEHGAKADWLAPDAIDGTVEEILRYDPPLHMFTRYAYEDVEIGPFTLPKDAQIGLMLGAAGRDPQVWEAPDVFDPTRPVTTHVAFGAGRHFCVGAPLARLELRIALPILFARCPALSLNTPPLYANLYHFHGLESLEVTT